MSSISTAVARRRTYLLAASFIVPVLCLHVCNARAQQVSPDQLPPIEVSPPKDGNRTRAKSISDEGAGARRTVPSVTQTSKPNVAPRGTSDGSQTRNFPPVREFNGIVGASRSVISAEDIARSPAQTIHEIIAQTPGVQLTTLF